MFDFAYFLFSDKWGVAPDCENALYWLKKAADMGHAGSLDWLSDICGCKINADGWGPLLVPEQIPIVR